MSVFTPWKCLCQRNIQKHLYLYKLFPHYRGSKPNRSKLSWAFSFYALFIPLKDDWRLEEDRKGGNMTSGKKSGVERLGKIRAVLSLSTLHTFLCTTERDFSGLFQEMEEAFYCLTWLYHYRKACTGLHDSCLLDVFGKYCGRDKTHFLSWFHKWIVYTVQI